MRDPGDEAQSRRLLNTEVAALHRVGILGFLCSALGSNPTPNNSNMGSGHPPDSRLSVLLVFDRFWLFTVLCWSALWFIWLPVIGRALYITRFLTWEDLYLKELVSGAWRAVSSLEPVYNVKSKTIILLDTTQISEIKWLIHLCSPNPCSGMSNVCLDFYHTLHVTNQTKSKLSKRNNI